MKILDVAKNDVIIPVSWFNIMLHISVADSLPLFMARGWSHVMQIAMYVCAVQSVQCCNIISS